MYMYQHISAVSLTTATLLVLPNSACLDCSWRSCLPELPLSAAAAGLRLAALSSYPASRLWEAASHGKRVGVGRLFVIVDPVIWWVQRLDGAGHIDVQQHVKLLWQPPANQHLGFRGSHLPEKLQCTASSSGCWQPLEAITCLSPMPTRSLLNAELRQQRSLLELDPSLSNLIQKQENFTTGSYPEPK